jgi:hypothetical protein
MAEYNRHRNEAMNAARERFLLTEIQYLVKGDSEDRVKI